VSSLPPSIRPSVLPFLTGDERFAGLNASVVEFWRWAFGDVRDNTTRGVLAEFLVARALGDVSKRREGWANYDVLTPSGIRVEVKSSGRLQSWSQSRLSQPSFSRLTGRAWDPDTTVWGDDREIRADVFVFALQTCTDPSQYDVLDLAQWAFYVASAEVVESVAVRSISLATLQRVAGASVSIRDLADKVEAAHSPTEDA
jgi:hypothetical protein